MWVPLPDRLCLWWTTEPSESSKPPTVSASTWGRLSGLSSMSCPLVQRRRVTLMLPRVHLPSSHLSLGKDCSLSWYLMFLWSGQSWGKKKGKHIPQIAERSLSALRELPFYSDNFFSLKYNLHTQKGLYFDKSVTFVTTPTIKIMNISTTLRKLPLASCQQHLIPPQPGPRKPVILLSLQIIFACSRTSYKWIQDSCCCMC